MVPTSSVHCYRWILVEKELTRLLCGTNQQSRPETFQMANGSFLEFRKKIFPATQNCRLGEPSQKSLRIVSLAKPSERVRAFSISEKLARGVTFIL